MQPMSAPVWGVGSGARPGRNVRAGGVARVLPTAFSQLVLDNTYNAYANISRCLGKSQSEKFRILLIRGTHFFKIKTKRR